MRFCLGRMLDKSVSCLFPNVVWYNRSYKHVFLEMRGRSNERRFVGTVGGTFVDWG